MKGFDGGLDRDKGVLRKLINSIYEAGIKLSDLRSRRFLQEHRITSREQEIEKLRAMAYLKVIENNPASEEERKSRVICVLVEDKAYRRAITSIRRHRLIINRFNTEIAVLEAGIGKMETEEQMLLNEITTTDRRR